MRLDRSRRTRDIWLEEKMVFFAIGAALGLGGIVTGHDWLVWAAIVVLLIGFAMRILGRRRGAATDDGVEDDGVEDDGVEDDGVEDDGVEDDGVEDLPPANERGDWAGHSEVQDGPGEEGGRDRGP